MAFETPAAISVMTSGDILRSGARTLPDLLRLIPGVNVAQVDSSEWAVGIRGFQGELSKSMLVLIDGRSVYTPLFAGVYWDMQDVMLQDIDRIEVIRGPGGTIWGSNAVNGVINVITKSATETRGMLVSMGSGNVDQGFLNWRYGGGDDRLSYRVYGKGFTRAPQRHASGSNFDDWRRGQAGFRMDWNASRRDSITFQGDLYGGEAGQALQVSAYTPPSIDTRIQNRLFNGQNSMLTWRRVFDSGSDFQLKTFYDRTDREEANYAEVRHTFDVDFIHRIPLTRHEFTWGAGARISPSVFTQTVETVDFQPHEHVYNIFSAFLQDQISLVQDRLYLTIGSKLEHTTYSGFNIQPSARIAWTPSRRTTFWGAVSRAVRTAARVEDNFRFTALLEQNPPTYIRLIGDSGFDPERMLGYEFGARHLFGSAGFIGISLFHNRYDDLLSIEPAGFQVETDPGPPRLILPLPFRNGISAATSGGEVNTLWDMTDWWRVRSSYSLVLLDAKRDRNSTDPATVGQLEGDTPQHRVVVQSIFGLPKDLELDLVYRYVSSIPRQAVPAYSTGDVRIAKRINDKLVLEAVGRNLLQPRHFEYAGNPGGLVGIRRSAFVSLTWTPW